MKRIFLILPLCFCCLAATKRGPAQNAPPRGPIRLERGRSTAEARGPVYTLRFLQVSGPKPTEYVWLLQRETDPSAGSIEPNETVFRSLNSPVLREFVSRLPSGTSILHSPRMLPGPDPTMKVGSDSEPGLQDFIQFCRRKGVGFNFGIAF